MLHSRLLTTLLAAGLLAAVVPPAHGQGASTAYFEFLMARRLESLGDFKGAEAALVRAAEADSGSAEIRAEMAAFHLRRSQPDEAEKAAKSALAISDDSLEAHRTLGLVYAGYTESSSARTPTPPAAEYLRDAIVHLERAASSPTSPSDLILNYTLGRLYLRSGTPDKAIQTLNRVLSQNPGAVQARLSLAQAYSAASDLKGAIETLEVIVDDEPRVAAFLGQYQEQAGLLKEAAESYTKALAVQPMNRDLKFRRIAALYNAKEFSRAATFAADARRQHPEDARFPRLQARALFDTGDRSAGIAVLEAASRTFPKDTSTHYALADLYRDAGRSGDAEKTLRLILELEPANANALNYLGYLLALRGEQLDEAIQLVRRALDVEPENGAYLDSLGWAYFKRGDFGQAEKYLGAAAERLPRNSEVQDHLGDVLVRRGRLQDAIAAWTRALEGDGADIDKEAIQKKISNAKSKMQNAK
jgi:tetratricopeptide (TPR) repeat protein